MDRYAVDKPKAVDFVSKFLPAILFLRGQWCELAGKLA
jgi:hypothetical protein